VRIVGGKFRGRRLEAPQDRGIRPTADRTREALFNILEGGRFGPPDLLQDARVLDAFAGSGALGLEALSRGAAAVFFLEAAPDAAALCRANIAALGVAAQATLIIGDAARPPKAAAAADLVLMDPPYGEGLAGPALAALTRQGWLAEGALAVIEAAAKEKLPAPAGFTLMDRRRYGKAELLFLKQAT
jgi:16S rRNA (guanine966-N2)-methyltransferase